MYELRRLKIAVGLLTAVVNTATRARPVWFVVVTGMLKAEREYWANIIAFVAFTLSIR